MENNDLKNRNAQDALNEDELGSVSGGSNAALAEGLAPGQMTEVHTMFDTMLQHAATPAPSDVGRPGRDKALADAKEALEAALDKSHL